MPQQEFDRHPAPVEDARGRAEWISFWNTNTTIYVSERHKQVHYRQIANDFAEILPQRESRVLDFGCGEALYANVVAQHCSQLVLCDAAEAIRSGLKQRFKDNPRITVASPEEVSALPHGSFDVIFANSVLQYFARSQLAPQLAEWHHLLAPRGQLVLGDLIPSDAGVVSDASALLRFAFKNGFGIAASAGLVKTFFSDYRKKRSQLGLLRFSQQQALDLARSSGFQARRLPKNIGHNQARITIVAEVVQ
jgi:SAM-dependent methyltransferase